MSKQETNQSSKETKLSKRLLTLHNAFGLFVRFMPDPPADPPANPPADPPPTGVFTLPEQYKDKKYLEGIDSYDKTFKLLDDSQTLIGKKRTILPDETSTPNDIAEFNKLRGVPDDHSTYTSIKTEEGADTTFFDALKPAFKKANMTAKDVGILEAELGPIIEKITGTKVEADKAHGEAFEALTDKIFAGTKETDLAQAKILIDAHTPEGLKKYMNELSNEHLAIVACVMKGVRAKYIREDTTDNGGGVDLGSAEAIRAECKTLMAIAMDPTKSENERSEANKKADVLYEQHDKMTKNN